MTTGAGTYYLHQDPLGSVTDLTDASGNPQWAYRYEPYGATLTTTNVSGTAPENRLRFNGQYVDSESGDYHLRARQYDPTTGRFGSLDPLESPLFAPVAGAYVYVDGRPTVLVDPLGLGGWDRFKGALGTGARVIRGGARAVEDTALAALPYTNPFGATYASARRFYDAYRTYKAYGGGWIGALEATQQFNPTYPFVFNLELCLESNSANGAGYNCTNALVDGALLVAGARACARIPAGATAADVGLASRRLRPAAGTRVKPEGIPETWRIRGTKTADGTRYYDPANPGNSVRVMQGNPNSPYPNSQRPYVRWQRNGQPLDERKCASVGQRARRAHPAQPVQVPTGSLRVTVVLIDQVRAALDELSNLEYQSRVWTGRGAPDEMSSFVECVERLFDDSGLELALEAGEPVFGPRIDEELRELGDVLVKIDGGQSPNELIRDPRMQLARDRAAAILRAIEEEIPNAPE